MVVIAILTGTPQSQQVHCSAHGACCLSEAPGVAQDIAVESVWLHDRHVVPDGHDLGFLVVLLSCHFITASSEASRFVGFYLNLKMRKDQIHCAWRI